MQKKILFSLLFLSLLAKAQTFTIKGKVTDENNQFLQNVTVLIEQTNKGVFTDYKGFFSIDLPKGSYTIRASSIGYATIYKEILLDKNKEINFTLQSSSTTLEEVSVSAIRVKADVPVTFSNLSKKEISKRNLGQDIPVLMGYLPNVTYSSDAGAGIGYTQMSVRGSNSERINVTINGIPYNDAESHNTFWVNLGDFASSTQNLQLQRGVGTSTNGSGSFGASLNILTDATSKNPFAEISNSFGSFNTRKHTVKFSAGKLNDNVEITGRMSKIYSDGYVDRAYADLKTYFLQGSYSDENNLIKIITFGGEEKTYQSWAGIDSTKLTENRTYNPYTYENEIDSYKQNHYQFHWNKKYKNWTANLGLNYTKGAGFFEQFKGKQKFAAEFNNLIAVEDILGTDVIVRRWLDNNFYVANLNVNYKADKFDLIVGTSYSKYTGDHFGEVIWAENLAPNTKIRDRYYFSDAKKTEFSAFVKTNFKINKKLSGYIDLQGRTVSYRTKGTTAKFSKKDNSLKSIDVDKSFTFFNPKFGLTYNLNESNSLYTSFAIANREPNRNDFEDGVTTHETLKDLELGWRLNSKNIKLNTNIYYMNYKNQLVLTGDIDDVGAPVRAASGDSYRLGLEIDADIKIIDKLSVRPNASFSKNKNKDFFIIRDKNKAPEALGNTDISFSPSIVLGNIITYEADKNFQVSLLSKYVGKQLMSNFSSAVSDNDVLDGYFTSDLNVVYEIRPNKLFKSATISALVNNIFNAKYVNRGYYWVSYDENNIIDSDGAGYYPQATVNFLIGLTLNF